MQSISAVVAAVWWLQNVLLGSLATSLAVFAIAWVGIEMLLGRFSARSALRALVGAFVLFGAPLISAGLLYDLHGHEQGDDMHRLPPPAPPNTPSNAPVFDPYAGAMAPTN